MTQVMDAPTTAIQRMPDLKKPPRDMPTISLVLSSKQIQARMAEVLPPNVKIEWLTRVALMAISRNNDLLECTSESIYRSVTEAGSLGLNPSGGALGEAYLVPFKGNCQLIIGYRGLIVLARRSAEVNDVDGDVVYAGDHFVYRQGMNPVLEHTPKYDHDRKDENIIGAWVIFRMKNGVNHPKFVPRCDIEKRRAVSPSGKGGGGIWKSWYPDMCMKTAIRIAVKLVPASSEDLARALDLDDKVDRDDLNVIEAQTGGTKARTAAMMDKLAPADLDAHPPHTVDGEIIDAETPTAQTTPKQSAATTTPHEGRNPGEESQASGRTTKAGDSAREEARTVAEAIPQSPESDTQEPEAPEIDPDAYPYNCSLNAIHELAVRQMGDLEPDEAVRRFDLFVTVQVNAKGRNALDKWNKTPSNEKLAIWKRVLAKDTDIFVAA